MRLLILSLALLAGCATGPSSFEQIGQDAGAGAIGAGAQPKLPSPPAKPKGGGGPGRDDGP